MEGSERTDKDGFPLARLGLFLACGLELVVDLELLLHVIKRVVAALGVVLDRVPPHARRRPGRCRRRRRRQGAPWARSRSRCCPRRGEDGVSRNAVGGLRRGAQQGAGQGSSGCSHCFRKYYFVFSFSGVPASVGGTDSIRCVSARVGVGCDVIEVRTRPRTEREREDVKEGELSRILRYPSTSAIVPSSRYVGRWLHSTYVPGSR